MALQTPENPNSPGKTRHKTRILRTEDATNSEFPEYSPPRGSDHKGLQVFCPPIDAACGVRHKTGIPRILPYLAPFTTGAKGESRGTGV